MQQYHFRTRSSAFHADKPLSFFWNVAIAVFLFLLGASFVLGGLLFYQFVLIDDAVVVDDAVRALSGSVNKAELEQVIRTLGEKEALFEKYSKEKPDFANPPQ